MSDFVAKLCLFCLFLFPFLANAQALARLQPSTPVVSEPDEKTDGVLSRLRTHEDTYVFYHHNSDNQLDRHLDVQYSLKYLFGDEARKLEPGESDWEISFTFTGEFDFYALSRDSGPVIGRRYNPGIMYERHYGNSEGLKSFTASIEHESNGQSDNTLQSVRARALGFQQQYQQEHPDIPTSFYTEMAVDSVSRSTEAFVALGTKHRYFLGNEKSNCEDSLGCVELYTKFRQSFLDVEDEVFWDSGQANARLLEHQGTQLALLSNFDKGKQSLSLMYRTGQLFGGSPGDKNTFDASYIYTLTAGKDDEYTFPIVVAYHHGYLEELSHYSNKTSFFTVGLQFSMATF